MSKLKHKIEGRRQGGDDHISQIKDLCFLYLEKDNWCFIYCMGRYILPRFMCVLLLEALVK